MSIKDYIDITKQIHTIVRKTSVYYDGTILTDKQRMNYQYLQDLANRADYGVDWTKELKERQKPQVLKLGYSYHSGF